MLVACGAYVLMLVGACAWGWLVLVLVRMSCIVSLMLCVLYLPYTCGKCVVCDIVGNKTKA